MTKPTSLAQLRRVTQPPEVRLRANAEHWTASLYLRDLSPYLTWLLLRTSVSANSVTGLMILVGWSTAAALLIPGIWGPVLAVILGQLQMLVDCSDGEVARWRKTKSPAGVFLDKVGHYTTEALIPVALGIRAATLPLGGAEYLWTTLGLLLGLIIVLNKALNDMVTPRPRRPPRARWCAACAAWHGSSPSTGYSTRSSSPSWLSRLLSWESSWVSRWRASGSCSS